MFFSVVTVTFRNLNGLRRTAASLPPAPGLCEWIVIDGASDDGTAGWLASQTRPDLSWISEPDAGIFEAMNKGIAKARGDYVIFMNAGDCFAAPDLLQQITSHLGAARPDLIYGDSLEQDQRGGAWHKPSRNPAWNCYAMFTHHQSILYRRDSLTGGYDPAYRFSGDWALTARILRAPGASHLRFPGVICHFLRGGVSQRGEARARINHEHWQILRRDCGLSLPLAWLLYCIKLTANHARRRLPGLYDQLRFSQPQN